jgi:hypothetical protein
MPTEMIINIAIFIQKITDMRQFTKTCSRINTIVKPMIVHNKFNIKCHPDETNALIYEQLDQFNQPVENFIYPSGYYMEKFTMELCNDGYFKWLPLTYLHPKNTIIVKALTIYGQLDLLKIAINNGCKLLKDLEYDYDSYDANGHLLENSCHHAIISGNVKVLEFVISQGCKFTYETFDYAVECDNIDMVKFLKESGCVMINDGCEGAAVNGNIEMMKLLISYGDHIDSDTFNIVVECGHLNILPWLQSQGCTWDVETCNCAASGGHLEILIWLIDSGCPFSAEGVYYSAASRNHVHIIDWMKSKKYKMESSIFKAAALDRNLELLKSLRGQCDGWNTEELLQYAMRCGNWETAKWLREGCP